MLRFALLHSFVTNVEVSLTADDAYHDETLRTREVIQVMPINPILRYLLSQDTDRVFTQGSTNPNIHDVFKTPYQYWHEYNEGRRRQTDQPIGITVNIDPNSISMGAIGGDSAYNTMQQST